MYHQMNTWENIIGLETNKAMNEWDSFGWPFWTWHLCSGVGLIPRSFMKNSTISTWFSWQWQALMPSIVLWRRVFESRNFSRFIWHIASRQTCQIVFSYPSDLTTAAKGNSGDSEDSSGSGIRIPRLQGVNVTCHWPLSLSIEQIYVR